MRKSVQDSVPKAVMHCLVSHIRDELQSKLVTELYKTEEFDELMEESPETSARRRQIGEMVTQLSRKLMIYLMKFVTIQYEPGIVGNIGYDY